MWLNFNDIVESLNLDLNILEKVALNSFEFLETSDKSSSEDATKLQFNNDIQSYKNDYIDSVDILSEYYYEKIFNKGFCISVEDIATNLDVSLSTVTTLIIPKLDRIELPTNNPSIKFHSKIKSHIKNNLMQKHFTITAPDKSKILLDFSSDGISRKYFSDRFRKKVLYSMDSYVKFLEDTLYLVNDKMKLYLEFELDKLMDHIDATTLFKNDTELINYFTLVFNRAIISDSTKGEYSNISNYLNIKDYIYSSLNPFAKSKNSDTDLCFKSANSLKVIFNKIYLTEILREIEKIENALIFSFKVDNSKKPFKRYLMSKKFLVSKFEKSLDSNASSNSLDLEEETSIAPENKTLVTMNLEVPRYYFISKFNGDVKVFKDFLINSLKNSHN
ncbi:TPA: hypothetical protein ACF0PM_002146 [Clostridium perfringens]